jgi:thiol-disulfide isomerase/thioredoxin
MPTTKQFVPLVSLLSVLLVVNASSADEFNMDITAAGVRPGGHVSGPELSPEKIAHRVVLLEFWGVNCPPCIRSMPLLEELHKSLGPQGLVVIGAHAQGGTAEQLRPQIAQLNVTFTILDGASVEGGGDFQGIPHCMLFDHTGKCVYRGSPFKAQEAVVAAVKSAPGAVLEGRTLKKIPDLNLMLRDEGQFVAALKKARAASSSKDADMAEEAAFVIEKVEGYGRRMLDDAKTAKQEDPVRAADLLQRCSALLKGSDIGTEAAKLNASWRKDRDFQAAVKAGQQLAQLERMRAYVLDTLNADADAAITPEMVASLPPNVVGKIKSLARGIEKAAPQAPAAKKAAAIAAEFDRRAAPQ